LKEVPAIIGADMKTYGPFKVEDVAALPVENTKILVKQGLAERVETD
jgi:DNA replication initiation complex subunit (GINS family)